MGVGRKTRLDDNINEALVQGKQTVGTTEVAANVSGTNLDNRQELVVFNNSNKVIYYGPTGVTSSGANEGLPIDTQETVNITCGPDITVYLIAGTSGNEVIIQEWA